MVSWSYFFLSYCFPYFACIFLRKGYYKYIMHSTIMFPVTISAKYYSHKAFSHNIVLFYCCLSGPPTAGGDCILTNSVPRVQFCQIVTIFAENHDSDGIQAAS